MLRFKLKELTDQVAIYYYFPEWHTDSPGTVGLNLMTGKRLQLDASEMDPHYSYGSKMWRRIEEFAKNGSFEDSGIVAWC